MLSTTDIYRGSVPVGMAYTRTAFIFDKDGTLKNNTLDTNPSDVELAARKEVRSISSRGLEITSTAQDPGMGMSRKTFNKSVKYGYDRPAPNWVLGEDKLYSYQDMDKLREFDDLLDFGAMSNFGYGVGVLNNGGYIFDHEYERILGGASWRPPVLKALQTLGDKNPELELSSRFAVIENSENFLVRKKANVMPFRHRIQLDWEGGEGLRQKERFALLLLIAQLQGLFPRNVVLVDESNPHKDRYTTYLVPKKAQKERSMQWLFNQICFHSGVSLSEFKIVTAGDTGTDLQLALYGLQGCGDVTGILAAGSRVAESLHSNKLEFAGVPLHWGRRHEDLTPRYTLTDTPGVYLFRAHRLLPPRTIILADYAPWSKGLGAAESVLACLHHLGYKSSASA